MFVVDFSQFDTWCDFVYFVGVRVVTEREKQREREIFKRGETVVERRIVVEVKKKNKKKRSNSTD